MAIHTVVLAVTVSCVISKLENYGENISGGFGGYGYPMFGR
jgi:hypothetical protein